MANETYSTLVDNLRIRLDEVGVEGMWTDAELLRYLSEGARDISRKAECNRATSDIDWPANDFENTGPTDAVRIHRCEWIYDNDTRIVPLLYQDFDALDAIWYTGQQSYPGEPKWWTTWGYAPNLSMKVYPIPPRDGTLRVHYYKIATIPTSDTENVDLPAGWEDVLLDHGCYKAMMKDRDSRWQQYKALYDENLASLVDTAARFADTVGMITNVSGVGIPAWLYDEGWVG